jgi:hypothetical protein
MSQLSLSTDGELAKFVLHNPPQNRLTQPFFAELGEAIAEIGRSGARARCCPPRDRTSASAATSSPGRSSARTNCASRSSTGLPP